MVFLLLVFYLFMYQDSYFNTIVILRMESKAYRQLCALYKFLMLLANARRNYLTTQRHLETYAGNKLDLMHPQGNPFNEVFE